MTEASSTPTRASNGSRELWWFVGSLVLLGLGGMALLWQPDHVVGTVHMPWWLLAGLFYLSETFLVHLYFRRGAHSFSMSEVPLVLGLFFATPRELLLTQFLGCMVALVAQRRLTTLKAIFNLANFAVLTSVSVLLVRAAVPSGSHLGVRAWFVAFLAVMVYAVLGSVNVGIAIRLSERRVEPRRFMHAFFMLSGSSLTNLSIGLVAATVVDYRASAAWLLLVPAVTVFLAYRAYIREREKHDILEFLYEATRILTQNPDFEQAIAALLVQTRDMFRSEKAEAIIAPPEGAPVLRIRLDEGAQPAIVEAVAEEAVLGMWEKVAGLRAPIVIGTDGRGRRMRGAARTPRRAGRRSNCDSDYLASQGLQNAMLAPLRGEQRAIGMLALGDRQGEPAFFDAEDIRLFDALTNHVSVALENGRLEHSLTQLRELEQRLTQLAFHDTLTGLPNRALFSERVAEAVATAKEQGGTCAVLFIDLDDFKTVNDTLGHDAGDELLEAVAVRITECLRPSDQPARLGGDEFAVIVNDAFSSQAAERIAARITDALRRPIPVHGCDVHMRASIGIATSQDVHSADEMLRNADLAMYIAKADGKGRYRWFRQSMRADVVRRHQLKSDLEQAAERGEFQVHYQPIVDLRSGRPVAAEALVRWAHPQRGLVLPASFIPAAERSGLINEIGSFVLHNACQNAANWLRHLDPDAGMSKFAVAVNLSPAQFTQHDLVMQVDEAIDAAGIDPSNLILEITEGLMLEGSERVMRTLELLHGFGVQLAMDDFGTGYASLASLRKLPMDMIKIAKTFTDDINGNEEKSPFIRAMIELGEALGLVTLAEGIETAQQARELERLGCQLGQGYMFARPVPAGGIDRLLQRQVERETGLAKVIAFPA